MEICQIEIKFGFWKNFIVFALLVSDFRAVWWQKDLHQQLLAVADFHNRIKKKKKIGAGEDENLLIYLLYTSPV